MAGAEGVLLERPRGAGEYILLHFWQPMHLLCGGEMLMTKPDACIVFSPDTPQKFYNYTHDMVHDWIHITGDAAEALDSYGLKPDQIYYPENCGFITEIVREMETEFLRVICIMNGCLIRSCTSCLQKFPATLCRSAQGCWLTRRWRRA